VGVHWCVVSWAGVISLGLCRCWCWGGGSRWRISRPERVTSAGEIKLYVRGNSRCVLDPCLGYTERYLRVALEIHRIYVLLLVLVLLWCCKLSAALTCSCIVTGDHYRIGVLSVVIVILVIDSGCGTETVLCMWDRPARALPHCSKNTRMHSEKPTIPRTLPPPHRTHTLLWTHPQHYANITTTKQRSTFKHYRTILNLCLIH